MKKLFLFALAALAGIVPAAAEGLTAEQALARALKTDGPAKARALKPAQLKLAYTAKDAAFYAFNRADNDGFIIASGDTRMRPVLGVSDSGSFDETNPALAEWLDFYSQELAYAKDKDEVEETTVHEQYAQWTKVDPICTTRWNQTWPYNDRTPLMENGNRTVTGCVATAMAQVIKAIGYYEGKGSNTYECAGIGKKMLTYDFTKWKPDFSKMPDAIDGKSPQEHIDEIAELMLACGMAVNMNFSAVSGASLQASKIINHFGYDDHSVVLSRENYTTPQWESIVYNQIAAGYPVYYAGSGKGGHAFVCDGYSPDGLFHFNWGWGGINDGYFALSSLIPSVSVEVAGGFRDDSYNNGQNICLFVTPDAPKPVLDTPNRPVSVVYGSELELPTNQGKKDHFGMMWTIFNTPGGKGTYASIGLTLCLKSVDGSTDDIYLTPTEYKNTAVREVKWNFDADFASVPVPAGDYEAYVYCAVSGYDGYWPLYYSGAAIKPNVDHWDLTVHADGSRTYKLANFKNNDIGIYNMNVNDFYPNDYDNNLSFTIANLGKFDWNEKISVRVFNANGNKVNEVAAYPYVSFGQAKEYNVQLPINAAGKYTAKVYRDSYQDMVFPNATLDFEVKSGNRPFGGKGLEPAGSVTVGIWNGEGEKAGQLQPLVYIPGTPITGTTALTSYSGKPATEDYYLAIADLNDNFKILWKEKIGTATVTDYGWIKGHDFSVIPDVPVGKYTMLFIDKYETVLSYGAAINVCDVKDGFCFDVDNNSKTATLIAADASVKGAVVIPSEVNGIPVTTIAREAMTNRFDMTELTIPASIESIELDAFRGCAGLRKVTFLGSKAPFESTAVPFYGIKSGAKFYCSDEAYDDFAAAFHLDGNLYCELTSFDVPAELNVMAGHTVQFKPITNTPHYDPELLSAWCVDFNVLQVEFSPSSHIYLRGIAPGTATLNVVCSKPAVTKTLKVNVTAEVKISLDKTDVAVNLGDNVQLTATLTPASELPLTWVSSDPSVATVDDKGLVTGVSKGTAVISVYVDGNEVPATCQVKVTNLISSIKIEPETVTIIKGEWAKLIAVVTPEELSKVAIEWSSEDTKIVNVTKEGNIYGVSVGTTRVYVKANDGSGLSASAIVTVTDTDGILETRIEPGSVEVYDLQGRRVNNPRRGVYIVNGKTVVLK